MNWDRAANWLFGLVVAATIGGAYIYHWSGREEAERKRAIEAEKSRIAAEQYKAKREQQCALVNEALAVVASHGRADLAKDGKYRPACERIEVEDCGYKVELLYELHAAGKPTLVETLSKIGEDCKQGLEFATKHGLPAFRDHHKILTEAIEGERDIRELDDYSAPPDNDVSRWER